jgi:hypothetical protein
MRRSTVLLLVAIVILLVTAWGFRPEAAALAWHLRHGVHAQGAGLRVPVPLLYSAMEGQTSLILMSPNGRARTRLYGAEGALVFVSKRVPAPQSPDETAEQWWKRTEAAVERQGARQTSARTLSLAGGAEHCYEFEGGLFLGVEIWCVPDSPGGWFVDYTGPRAHVPQFYSILDSAQAR